MVFPWKNDLKAKLSESNEIVTALKKQNEQSEQVVSSLKKQNQQTEQARLFAQEKLKFLQSEFDEQRQQNKKLQKQFNSAEEKAKEGKTQSQQREQDLIRENQKLSEQVDDLTSQVEDYKLGQETLKSQNEQLEMDLSVFNQLKRYSEFLTQEVEKYYKQKKDGDYSTFELDFIDNDGAKLNDDTRDISFTQSRIENVETSPQSKFESTSEIQHQKKPFNGLKQIYEKSFENFGSPEKKQLRDVSTGETLKNKVTSSNCDLSLEEKDQAKAPGLKGFNTLMTEGQEFLFCKPAFFVDLIPQNTSLDFQADQILDTCPLKDKSVHSNTSTKGVRFETFGPAKGQKSKSKSMQKKRFNLYRSQSYKHLTQPVQRMPLNVNQCVHLLLMEESHIL